MTDSIAKKRWMKENTTIIAAKLNNRGDKDILDYLSDKATATIIKAAIREYMVNHPSAPQREPDEPPPWLDDDELPV